MWSHGLDLSGSEQGELAGYFQCSSVVVLVVVLVVAGVITSSTFDPFYFSKKISQSDTPPA
jgi:hypothetical protein